MCTSESDEDSKVEVEEILLNLDLFYSSHSDDESPKTSEKKKKKGNDASTLSYRQVTHDNFKKKFDCDKCGKIFSRQDNLNRHTNNVHLKKFVCVTCDKVFSRHDVFACHLKNDHPESEFSGSDFSYVEYINCSICNESFSHASSLYRHRMLMHENSTKKFDCVKCGKIFSRQDNLTRHINNVHLKKFTKKFGCVESGKTYSHQNVLESHIKNDHSESQAEFKCNICDKHFSYAFSLYRHVMLMHDNSTKKFDCVRCGKVFSRQDNLTRHTNNVHYKIKSTKKFDCVKCGKIFSRKDSLARHTKNGHFKKCTKKFDCVKCGKVFSYQDFLAFHVQNDHLENEFSESNFSQTEYFEGSAYNESFSCAHSLSHHELLTHDFKKIDCDKCGKTFSRHDNLTRHTKYVHLEKELLEYNFSETEYFECSECGIKFSSKVYLKRHVFNRHTENTFECEHCGVKLRYKNSIIRHLWTKHLNEKLLKYDRMTQACALCEFSCTKKIDILHHYKVHHQLPLIEKRLNFNNYEEFLTWKIGIEDSSNSRFIIRNTHKGKSHTVILFCCHRSGVKKIKSADRKRRLRLKGSKKIGFVCPAEMRVRCNMINSKCDVSFYDIHVGHDVTSRTEISTLYLREKDRELLANKIAAGFSLNKILDDYQNDDVFENYLLPNLKRSDLLSNKELRNIIKTYNVKPMNNEPSSFSSDVRNVESFVKRYEPYILYYKKQYDSPDNQFPDLLEEDTVLIFMCNAQKLLLQKHRNNVIALDSTHNLNVCNFILQTILILDYDGEDYPVAFAISNRDDVVVTDIFLSCVKTAVGIIQPKTLMTDVQMAYFNSWQKIMMVPEYHLFCIWHVFKAWKRNINKIINKKKRKQILHKLYELISEINVDTFTIYLNELLNSADDDTIEFLDYIRTEYGNNVERWAYCYRLDAGLNSNLHLEAFYRSLKYIHGKEEKINSLYNGLEFIRNYLHRELNSINIKYTQGRITTKLRQLREIHDKASKVLAENNTVQVIKNEDGWSVESFKESDDYIREVYFIQQVCEKCPAVEDDDYHVCNLECRECGACAHLYRCTCLENTIRNSMCEHIHIALIVSNKTEDTSGAFVNTNDILKTVDTDSEYFISHSKDPQIMELRTKESDNKFMNSLQSIFTLKQLEAAESILYAVYPAI